MTINSISIIYIGIILCILLYIFKYIHAYAWGYKLVYISSQNSKKIQLAFSIGIQFFITCLFKFLIFVANELLGTKTEESKTN